ncbi:hypothetical protein [Desulfoferrobacter suflitae]|uniref:hypothetical protein n=1 Tax=Desulfoferrobacter suflitae TaxID=2865782 RepID=UPI00216431FF|nr:hypothetical protein [Desulfoferrobacter suflitae]MCK8603159.1 hypothetical protein [Desulfoferrobacter suflitae]
MKIIFALLLIIFLAFSGYHLSFRNFKLPLFARHFYMTGIEFIFLGLLLGPRYLNILDSKTQSGLAPLAALLLGWIGLLYGFQFEIKKLRRFPLEYLAAANLQAGITFFLVLFGAYFTLPYFLAIPPSQKMVVALTLAAAAACTAQTGLALMSPDFPGRRHEFTRFLRYISSIDGLVALVIFGFAYVLRPSVLTDASVWSSLPRAAIVSLGVCSVLLILFSLFLQKFPNDDELALIVVGMAIVISGTASILNFSPLLATFFVGFGLVNFSRDKERIYRILISIEKPCYLLLMVFLGVRWELETAWILLLAAGYWLWRFMGKVAGGFAVTRIVVPQKKWPANLGFGLVDQGGLAMVILLDFAQSFPFEISGQVISLALLAIVLSDTASPHLLRILLHRSRA